MVAATISFLVAQGFNLRARKLPIRGGGPRFVGLVLAGGMAALLCTGCVSAQKFKMREVAPGLFEGCKPVTAAQFEQLRARGIRTILSVQGLSWDIRPEARRAREHGLLYVDVPILASPFPPAEDKVKEALLILSDSSLRPIYFHCLMGEDRTTMLIGLYRMYYEDWTPEAAWEEMIRTGFHVRLSLVGFKTYFWHHTQKPDWVKPVGPPGMK